MQWRRLIRHLLAWRPRHQVLSAEQSQHLASLVQAMEAQHGAEVCICLERRWPLAWAASAATSRERAVHWFTVERVWDTEHNTGVLVYVNVADHAIEIVADRGLNNCISDAQWQRLLEAMRNWFVREDYVGGLQHSLTLLRDLLQQQLPREPSTPNELSDRPLVR